MKKNRYLWLLFTFLFVFFINCGEKESKNTACTACENSDVLYVLKDEPAHGIKGCFMFNNKVDTFSLSLVNSDKYEEIFGIFPCNGIPATYRLDSASVLISGNIINCMEHNRCVVPDPTWRPLPTYMFELTNIKNNTK